MGLDALTHARTPAHTYTLVSVGGSREDDYEHMGRIGARGPQSRGRTTHRPHSERAGAQSLQRAASEGGAARGCAAAVRSAQSSSRRSNTPARAGRDERAHIHSPRCPQQRTKQGAREAQQALRARRFRRARSSAKEGQPALRFGGRVRFWSRMPAATAREKSCHGPLTRGVAEDAMSHMPACCISQATQVHTAGKVRMHLPTALPRNST